MDDKAFVGSCLFLFLINAYAASIPAKTYEPEFVFPLKNVTIASGRDISFTCIVNHLGGYKVAWIKADDKAILAIHTHMVTNNARFSVTHNGHNAWSLHIKDVHSSDAGAYMCQVNTDPMRNQIGLLDVVVPPEFIYEETSGDMIVREGQTASLQCRALGLPTPQMQWKREDGTRIELRKEGSPPTEKVEQFDGEDLILRMVSRTDMGAYLCIAANGVPPSVSKRIMLYVHFIPLIKVSSQLVAAPVGSDVTLECYVEASPKAINTWQRDNGSLLLPGKRLIPSSKYDLEETPANSYALLMKLTIKDLEKKDFGSYNCTSANALGTAEGTVRLQELYLPPKTTQTPTPAAEVTESRVNQRYHNHEKLRHKPRPKAGKVYTFDDYDERDESAAQRPSAATTPTVQSGRASTGFPVTSTVRPPVWVYRMNNARSHVPCLPLVTFLAALALIFRVCQFITREIVFFTEL